MSAISKASFKRVKVRVDGGVGGKRGWVMGIEEGTFWDEDWVLYGNQLVNKFHIYKKNKRVKEWGKGTDRKGVVCF